MKFLTRDEILARTQREFGAVNGIRVRSLTDMEVSSLQAKWAHDTKDKSEDQIVECMDSDILVRSICDENGDLLFKENEAHLLQGVLGKYTKPAALLARKLSGMTSEDATEDYEKN